MYAAATKAPWARLSRLGDEYSLDCPASPEFVMSHNALALSKSTMMKRIDVKIGHCLTSGRNENSGSSNGAWWNTPPSYGLTLWLYRNNPSCTIQAAPKVRICNQESNQGKSTRRTSFKARDRGRDLDAAGQQVRKARKGQKQKKS